MWRSRKFMLMGLIPCLFFLVGLCAQLYQNRNFSRASGSLGDSAFSPYTVFQPEANPNPDTVAVILHGRRCSSSMMVSFARMMARNGFKAYALDLYGHGKSPFTLPLACPEGAFPNFRCRAEPEYLALTSESLRAIQRMEGDRLKNLIVVGHSWGGRLGHDLLKSWPLAGTKPFLINLDGELTGPGYFGESLYTVRVGPYQAAENQITLPESHLSIIHSEEVNENILAWLGRHFRLAEEKSPDPQFVLGLLLFVSLSVFCLWLIQPLSRAWPDSGLLPEPAGSQAFIFSLVLAVAAAVQFFIGGLPMHHFFQWQIYFQSIYLCFAGITGWIAGAAFLGWKKKRASAKGLCRSFSLALGTFSIQCFTIFWFADQNFFHLGFSAVRGQKFLLYLVLLLPLCLMLFRLSYRYRLATWIFLLAISTLGPKGMDPGEAAFLLPVLAFMEIFSERLARVSKSPEAGAYLFCLMLSWWAAAAYPTATFFAPSLKLHGSFFGLSEGER